MEMSNQEVVPDEAEVAPLEKKKKLPRGEVMIFREWCKRCGICIALCPQGVLEMNCDGRSEVARSELCTACRQCELHCPDLAITVWRIDGEEPERSR